MSPGFEVSPFWGSIGLAVAGILGGIGMYLQNRHRRDLAASDSAAGTAANQAIERAIIRLETELASQKEQIVELRAREARLSLYVGELIHLLRQHGITPPPMRLP